VGGAGIDTAAVSATAADPAVWIGRLVVTVDEAAGTLTIEAPLRRGEEYLDAMSAGALATPFHDLKSACCAGGTRTL